MKVIDAPRYQTSPHAIFEARKRLNASRRAIMRPPPRMNVADWADKYRRLSSQVSAVGGPWQTHRMEVARGALMAVTEEGVSTITVMSATQMMKTEVLLNTIGYFAHLDPAPILLLEPKDEMADAFSKERISPMVASSPVLKDLMGESRTRHSDNTLGFKKFPGGFLVMSSAGSPTNMAMRAIRVTLLDEIDKYETTKEGDPVELAEERTSTFTHSALHIRACSPTWVETSRIWASYMKSDQRRPFVACPHCDHEQDLDFFRHVHWQKDADAGEHHPETAAIHCEACGSAWTEAERVKIMTSRHTIRHKQTRPFFHCGEKQEPLREHEALLTNPDARGGMPVWDWDEKQQVGRAVCKHCGEHAVSNNHAGFMASKLYSPNITVVALVEKWLEVRYDAEAKQTFYNTQLGIPYKADVSKEVSAHFLASRREDYGAGVEVPEGVVALTFGVDVQAGGQVNTGRLECEVVGWGIGEESWSIDAKVFEGDPARPEVWADLDEYLMKGWRHARGFDMRVMAGCIDSGGHNTQEVYNFAKERIGRNVWAIKGSSDRQGQWSPVWPPLEKDRHKKHRAGYRPVMLGVNAGKEAVRQRLLVEKPGPGYCHFPMNRVDGWFDQLTSEELIVERKAGALVRRWSLKKGLANEALDARVYAYAALVGLYHTRRFKLEQAAVQIGNYKPLVEASPEEIRAVQLARAGRRVRRSSFMQG